MEVTQVTEDFFIMQPSQEETAQMESKRRTGVVDGAHGPVELELLTEGVRKELGVLHKKLSEAYDNEDQEAIDLMDSAFGVMHIVSEMFEVCMNHKWLEEDVWEGSGFGADAVREVNKHFGQIAELMYTAYHANGALSPQILAEIEEKEWYKAAQNAHFLIR